MHRSTPTPPTRRHRVAVLTVGLAAAILMAVGITGATAESKTTGVAITPLTPAKAVGTGLYVGPNKTYSFVASGGGTTVPTNAFVVELAVTVKGPAAGTLSFGPLGDPTATSPTKVSWPAGGSGAGTVKVNIGTSNKVVISNASTGAATVGLKITGYSTQTTAAGINGSGGTNGQVLTNNGNGTVGWKTPAAPPVVMRAHVDNGQVEFGDATSATRLSTGRYRVTFPRNLAGCVVVGSPGLHGGGMTSLVSVIAFLSNASSPGVDVYITRPDTLAPTDSDFSLIVAC